MSTENDLCQNLEKTNKLMKCDGHKVQHSDQPVEMTCQESQRHSEKDVEG